MASKDRAIRLTRAMLTLDAGGIVSGASLVQEYGISERQAKRDMRAVAALYKEITGHEPIVEGTVIAAHGPRKGKVK